MLFSAFFLSVFNFFVLAFFGDGGVYYATLSYTSISKMTQQKQSVYNLLSGAAPSLDKGGKQLFFRHGFESHQLFEDCLKLRRIDFAAACQRTPHER